MNTNIRTYTRQFNSDIVKDLQKIDKKIKEEIYKNNPDKEKILKLRQQQFLRGMELGSCDVSNFTRRFIPW